MRNYLATLFLITLTSSVAWADLETYRVDSTHSSASFRVRHFVGEVEGRFNNFGGTIKFDPDDFTRTEVTFTIQGKSIDTANAKRDTHLQSADFFDVEKYPTLEFKSTRVTAKDDKAMNVTGDITIHGVTRQITVPVRVYGPTPPDQEGSRTVGFQTEFIVNRDDFKMNNWKADSGILGEDVKVRIAVEAHSNWQE